MVRRCEDDGTVGLSIIGEGGGVVMITSGEGGRADRGEVKVMGDPRIGGPRFCMVNAGPEAVCEGETRTKGGSRVLASGSSFS
jgi:hypothetical protein